MSVAEGRKILSYQLGDLGHSCHSQGQKTRRGLESCKGNWTSDKVCEVYLVAAVLMSISDLHGIFQYWVKYLWSVHWTELWEIVNANLVAFHHL